MGVNLYLIAYLRFRLLPISRPRLLKFLEKAQLGIVCSLNGQQQLQKWLPLYGRVIEYSRLVGPMPYHSIASLFYSQTISINFQLGNQNRHIAAELFEEIFSMLCEEEDQHEHTDR